MQTEDLNVAGRTLRHFLFRTVLGRILHLLINAAVIAQLMRMDWRYAWAAGAPAGPASSSQNQVAEQLSPLSLAKNQPLGSDLTLDGHALVPNADANASFTWFGPFSTLTGPTVSVFAPEGHHTVTVLVDGIGIPPSTHTLDVGVSACFGLSARAKPGKVQ